MNQEKFEEIKFSFSDFYLSNMNNGEEILKTGVFPRPEEMFPKWQKCIQDVLATDEYKDLVVTDEDKLELKRYQMSSYNDWMQGNPGEEPGLYKYIYKEKLLPLPVKDYMVKGVTTMEQAAAEKAYLQSIFDEYLADAPDDTWEHSPET